MAYRVLSDRFVFPAGSLLSDSMLVGCNIEAAIAGGHLERVAPEKPSRKAARTPVRAEEQ
jgi:hypothetical protein